MKRKLYDEAELESSNVDWSTGGQRVEKKVSVQRMKGILTRGRLRLDWEDFTRRDFTKWERNGEPDAKIKEREDEGKLN